jgi:hypothetical protein
MKKNAWAEDYRTERHVELAYSRENNLADSVEVSIRVT